MRVSKLAIVCPSALVMGLTTSCLNFALVFYSHDKFGADTFQASLFGSLYSLSYLFCCSFGGKLLQKIPPLKSIIASLCCCIVGLFLMINAPSLRVAYVIETFIGIFVAFYWPQLMGWLSQGLEDKQLSHATSFFNFSWSTGTIIAPFLAGCLSDINSAYPIYACLCAAIVNLLYVTIASRGLEKDAVTSSAKEANTTIETEDHSPLIRFPSWYGLICAWFAIGFIYNAYPLMAEQALNYSRQSIGNFILLRALLATIMMTAMGFCAFWQFRYWQLVAGHALLAVNMLMFGYAKSLVGILPLIAISGVLCAHSYTNSMFHGISGCQKRTFRMAVHEALLSIGTVIGGALTGWLFEKTRSIAICGQVVAAVILSAVVCDIIFAVMATKHRGR